MFRVSEGKQSLTQTLVSLLTQILWLIKFNGILWNTRPEYFINFISTNYICILKRSKIIY